jgi:hydrogenase expression/formation protein HypC
MCLGVVGQVVEVEDMVALVDFFGVKKHVRLDTVDAPVGPGDYILNHVGFAIRRIPESEVQTTLAFYEDLLAENDLMARDVKNDLV